MSTFIGIDVSLKTLDIHIRPEGRALQVPNTPEGHRQLLAMLPAPDAVASVVLEATGGYETPVAAALQAAGYPAAIVNPRQVHDFAKAAGLRAKTDALDAAILARFAEAFRPQVRPVPSAELQEFRELLDRRDQLVGMQTMESNRLHACTQKVVRRDLEKHLAWLASRIKDVESQLNERVKKHLHWKEAAERLRTIPGIGVQTARVLIGRLPELGHATRRELATLVGLAPLNDDSGERRGARHIVGGRASVRKSLYMAAVATLKHNAYFKAMYAGLLARGKLPKVALIAIARKLLCIANSLLRHRTTWNNPMPQTA